MADNVYVFLGVYDSEEDARADYDVVKQLHERGVLGTYDAAVVTRDADGKANVDADEHPTRRGAWAGAAVGAVAGVLFPPSLLVSGAAGAGAGALIQHFRRGLSSGDVEELATMIQGGHAGLVVVTDAEAGHVLAPDLTRAKTTLEKGLEADAEFVDELNRSTDASA
jgi:uncharacterized membrane protein